MNLETYTDRSKGFLQAAQTIALREGHQQFAPEHLLKALLDDEEGLASGLIERAGGSAQRVRQANDLTLGKMPKVSGSGAGRGASHGAALRVLATAEQAAKKAGDSFVTAERLLLALALEKDTEAGKALSAAPSRRRG